MTAWFAARDVLVLLRSVFDTRVMTWVIGTPIIFGYGFALSDIRVTLANGEELDCLQKIYPVGQFVAAGFAGSVRIGFAMLETLSALLNVPEAKGGAWDPVAVAEWWQADAQGVFSKFPACERALQSHLLLVGVSPTENNGDAPWPKAYVYIFRSPDFKAEAVPYPRVGAIGSGNFVQECRELVENLSTNWKASTQLMRGEVGSPGGTGQMLGWSATTVLKKIRPNGISSHLHYCWVFRGRVVIQTNDHTTYGRWSSIPVGVALDEVEKLSGRNPDTGEGEDEFRHNFTMPTIARSWDEFQKILTAQGATALGVVG